MQTGGYDNWKKCQKKNKRDRFSFHRISFLTITRDRGKVRFHAYRWQAIFFNFQYFTSVGLSRRISVMMGMFFLSQLSNEVSTSHIWLLCTWIVTGATDWSFKLLIKLNWKASCGCGYHIGLSNRQNRDWNRFSTFHSCQIK